MSGTIVLGIGNRLGGDDAAGTYMVDIVNRRQQRAKVFLPSKIMAIDAGTAPESYTSVIRQHKPDLLILVDAADMGLPPGTLRTVSPKSISILSFSSHHIPLSVFVSYVKTFCRKVILVGVQPEQMGTAMGISKTVLESMNRLAEVILEERIAEIPLLK